MKYFEKRTHYTDGFYDATLTALKNGHFYGYVIETSYKGQARSLQEFTVKEYGSLKRCSEEALKDLKNSHFKKI